MHLEGYNDTDLLVFFRDPATKEQAFTAILNKYKERMYWHIRRLVIIHDDANDILQNVFIKVWNGLANFRGDSELYTWLYRISNNECITHLEKEKRRKTGFSGDVQALENKVKSENNFDASKIEWKLQLAIQQLPEQQRLVFTLRYFDEMPYQKMSEILQVTEGALKASYHIAAKKVEDYILNH